MTIKAGETEQVVAAAIREVSHIATLPEVTLKIVELVEDPTSTAQDLNRIISNDPALCSRILKVVNSSFYGLPGQIGSINRAIVLLGLNAVKNIAISASLAKLFKGGQLCPAFSAKDLWQHSIRSATTCKIVADELGLGVPDEAFLAGLIHDIGVMVELQYDRNRFIEVVNSLGLVGGAVPARDMLEVERSVFGATHQEFGRALCEKWKFPRSFAVVTGSHHDPLAAPADPHGARTLPCIVHVADRIAGSMDKGYRLDLPSLDYDAAVLDELKLTREALATIPERLEAQLAEVGSFME